MDLNSKDFITTIQNQDIMFRRLVLKCIEEMKRLSDANLNEEFLYKFNPLFHEKNEYFVNVVNFLTKCEVIQSRVNSSYIILKYFKIFFLGSSELNNFPASYYLKVNTKKFREIKEIFWIYNIDLQFISDTGILIVNKHKLIFNTLSSISILLNQLINHNDDFYRRGEFLDIIYIKKIAASEGITDALTDNAIYSAINRINEKIYKELQINNFLEKKGAKIRLNMEEIVNSQK